MSKDYYMASCHREVESPETTTPSLYDEYDRQEYYKEQMFSDPSKLGAYDFVPLTVIRGNGFESSSWSDEDYEEMSKLPCPEIPQGKIARKETPVETQEVFPDPIPAPCPVHTRIQITQYVSSKYQKGQSGNFEVNADYLKVYNLLMGLKDHTYSGPRSHRVRIQFQNKVNGKMEGGANLSVACAYVHEVIPQVRAILDSHCLIPPKPVSSQKVLGHSQEDTDPSPAVERKDNNINNKRCDKNEDGCHKPGESLGKNSPPSPLRYHTQKSPKRRITAEDLERELNIVLARASREANC